MIICRSLSRGGKEFELLGDMIVFKVDHQSFDDSVSDFSLFTMFLLHVLFESLIIPLTLFRCALNIAQ